MTPLVPIAIFGWIPVVLVLFAVLKPRRAAIAGFLLAWMFLPMAGFKVPGLPPADKVSVTSLGALLGTLMLDPSALVRIRPCIWDLPMVAWIAAPMPSAVLNGFGAYEGSSAVIAQVVTWGIPYLMGRAYMSDERGLTDFVFGCMLGGLVYVPLALFEARMSPLLHTWVYGFHQHSFMQSKRGDSFRPTVFMQHGLAVALFFSTASLCAFWLRTGGRVLRLGAAPMGVVIAALYGTTLACKSVYACLLLAAGTAILHASRALRTRALLFLLAALPVLYLTLRASGLLDTQVIDSLGAYFGGERGGSLSVRLASEDFLLRSMSGRMLFGGGRLDLVFQEAADDQSKFICDGLWLYALGRFGLVGLTSLFATMILPPVLVFLRLRSQDLRGGMPRAGIVVAVCLLLYAMDSLLNGMINPLYMMSAGGLVGWATGPETVRPAAGMPLTADRGWAHGSHGAHR